MKQKEEQVISIQPVKKIDGIEYDYYLAQRAAREKDVRKHIYMLPKYSDVIRNPSDPRLYIKAKKIKNPQADQVVAIAKTLVAHRLIEGALGVAANQIGCNLNMAAVAVLDESNQPTQHTYVLMNLRIIGAIKSPEDEGVDWGVDGRYFEEGCLSHPGVWGEVCRLKNIRFRCSTLTHPEDQEYTASGLMARVVQHEATHLLGKLFTDLGPLVRNLRVEEFGQLQLTQENFHAAEHGFIQPE